MDEIKIQAQSEEEERGVGEIVQQVIRVATKRRWWILLTGLGTLLLVVGGLSFVPNVYRSSATILVVEQQIPQNLVAPLSAATGTQKLQALAQEVLSRSSLIKIIDEFHLFANKSLPPDETVELMRKSINIAPDTVARDGSFSAFVISFSAPTPGLAQEVTRRLSSLFIERHSETKVNRANSTTGFLKDRLTEKKNRASELEQQIRNFKIGHAGELPESRLANETRMAELRVQLQNTLSSLSRAKQQRVIWESTLSGSLNGRLGRMTTERTALLARLTPKHPQVIAKDEEIAQMERVIANLRVGASVSEEQLERFGGDLAIGQLQGQLEANRIETEGLLRDQKRFEALINELQRHLNAAPVLEQQLLAMNREAEILNQEVSKLDGMDQQSALSADMERRQQGEQFRQLEFPTLPLKPLSPARLKISAAAAVFGLALGFIAAFLVDMRTACFHTEQEIQRKFAPLMVLSVPELPTPQELRMRKWRTGVEWIAASMVATTMLAVVYLSR